MKKFLSLVVLFGVLTWVVGCSEPPPQPTAPISQTDMDKYKPKPSDMPAADGDKPAADADKPAADADKPAADADKPAAKSDDEPK